MSGTVAQPFEQGSSVETTARVEFLLPGTWWQVDLGSQKAVTASARAMAIRTVGKSDEMAQVRREMTEHVVKAAESASAIDASEFYLALEVVPGAPMPLSLTIASPRLPDLLSLASGGMSAAISIKAALEKAGGSEVAVTARDEGNVAWARSYELLQGPVVPEAEPVHRLSVDYWLADRTGRTVLFAFSLAAIPEEAIEAVLELTDAIASTASWPQAAPASE